MPITSQPMYFVQLLLQLDEYRINKVLQPPYDVVGNRNHYFANECRLDFLAEERSWLYFVPLASTTGKKIKMYHEH